MYQDELISKARKLNRVINNEQLPIIPLDDVTAPKYDGSFKTIYDMVKEGRIKLLTQKGQVCGISVNSGTGSLEEDNLAGTHFAQAYSHFTALRYVQTALALKLSGVEVSDIVEKGGNVRIYLYREGKVLNSAGEVIQALSDEQIQKATMENVRELLDEKYNQSSPACEAKVTRDGRGRPRTLEIPSQTITISKEDAERLPQLNLRYIKKYLRCKYKRFIKERCDIQINRNQDGSVTVSNISWARPMAAIEIARH